MAIGNLANKVSSEDVEKVKDKRNPPEFEEGFGPSSGEGDGFEELFDEIDLDDFSLPSNGEKVTASSIFGADKGGASSFGQPSALNQFGQPSTFGQPNAFGQQINQQVQKVQPKPDTFDKVFDASVNSLSAIGRILASAYKSTKTRTADDWGIYGKNIIITSVIMVVASILISILGVASNVKALKFGGIPLQLILSALLLFGTGAICMAAAAFRIVTKASGNDKVEIPSNNTSISNDIKIEIEDEEDNLEGILGEMFGDNEDDIDYNAEEDNQEDEDKTLENEQINIGDYEEKLKTVGENVPRLSRELLYNTFKPFLPLNTPGFAVRRELDIDSQEFATIETICLKALAAASKQNIEDIDSRLESVVDTYFCYELRMKRVKGLTKLEDIAREITAYFRESSDDTSVSSEVDLEGDFYKIMVTKGINAIVTLGDILQLDYAEKFFKDINNALPIVAGVTEGGKPLLVDAKYYNTILVAGKPRSGKSWFIISTIMPMMMYNTPEDVVFLIIDPKESTLFKTIALMPHVCSIHNGKDILQLLRDVIDGEGARRKKLLASQKCDDIWSLRKRKGIMLPVLYVVIDEIMTIISNMGDNSKELFELMKIIISQLPSTGIRLMFVPHRAQGVVDKTIRTLLDFTAAVRAEPEVVKETLDIKKWDRPLLNPGDTAVKLQGLGREQFVKGLALTTSDDDNNELIINIARAFYKMGVEIPSDMKALRSGYNRNEEEIQKELALDNNAQRVQYNFDIDDVDEINNWGDME